MGPPNAWKAPDAWIAPLIEHCLSLYSRGLAEELDVEDDGSNLRFSIRSGSDTLINDWLAGDQTKWNVTDSKTQIDAFLSQSSLKAYHKTSPDKPLDRNVRGYIMELKEFQVVFVYTTIEPSVHLYVERFAIAWDKPKFKGPPQGRRLKKKRSTTSMMEKVLKDITSKRTAEETPPPHGSLAQPNGASQAYATQNPFLSQVQTPSVHGARAAFVTHQAHKDTSTDRLLGHLESHTKGTDNTVSPGKNHSPNKSRPNEHIPSNAHQPAVTPASNSGIPVNRVYEASKLPHEANESNKENKKRTTSPAGESNCGRRPNTSSPVKKAAPAHNVGSHIHESEVQADPWQGMTKIRKMDVDIPRNQLKLLEQHERNWLPPPPGKEMPQGCVPPELLKQWNDAVRLRQEASSSDSEESSSESIQDEPQPALLDLSKEASAADSEEDSDSDGRVTNWSSSPERNGTGRRELPEDSSPIKPKPVEQKAVSRMAKESAVHADEAPRESHARLVSSERDENDLAQDRILQEFVVEKDKRNSNGTSHENDHTVHKDTSNVDPGEESDESMMDTAVPCPLGRPSQAYVASQSDQEVSSSGPALPELQERVQVMETPAANFERTHMVVPKIGDQQGHEQTSPQVGKSSSQSRILNTYASDNPDVKDTHNTPNGTQSEHGAQNIDSMATQMSNGSWSMHDAMSLSSSAPKIRGPSPIPLSSNEPVPSSKPFSPHNEVISSIEGEDLGKFVIEPESPSRGVPLQGACPSPLKRLASEIDTDIKSLAKRHRISRGHSERTHGRESTTSAFNIVSRRESYISHNDDRAEAHRVFEKFRNDYPSYSGDFSHFSKTCFKLRALRAQDALKRSFLWDDFIIKNLEDFAAHLESSSSAETKPLPYEQFFLSTCSRPSYKKRSLTADGIEKAASQHVSYASESPFTDKSTVRDEATTSFTGSLVARFSNFHAHSFGPASEGVSDDNVDRMSTTLSPPAKKKMLEQSPVREDTPAFEQTSPAVSSPAKDNVQELVPPQEGTPPSHSLGIPSPIKNSTEEQLPAREDALGSDHIFVPMSPVFSSHPTPDKPDDPPVESVVSESQSQSQSQSQPQNQTETGADADVDANSDIAMMDVTHETASVELGEDSPRPATSPVPRTEDQAETDASKDEDEDENWFVSLRHMRDPEPGWWDDSNTPMKKWAQADQNVLSERVRRPGWSRIPVDEKGVIQPWRLQSK